MALIASEDDLKQDRPRLATFINWLAFLVCFGFFAYIAATGYFAENHGPQWLWDIYDWKVWPLRPFRQWRNSL